MKVLASTRKKRTVAEALSNGTWIRDIRGCLDVQVLIEYLVLWDLLQPIHTMSGQEDIIEWRWEASAQYTSRSAYKAFFHVSLNFACAEAIWKSWVALKCKYFMWLAVHRPY